MSGDLGPALFSKDETSVYERIACNFCSVISSSSSAFFVNVTLVLYLVPDDTALSCIHFG